MSSPLARKYRDDFQPASTFVPGGQRGQWFADVNRTRAETMGVLPRRADFAVAGTNLPFQCRPFRFDKYGRQFRISEAWTHASRLIYNPLCEVHHQGHIYMANCLFRAATQHFLELSEIPHFSQTSAPEKIKPTYELLVYEQEIGQHVKKKPPSYRASLTNKHGPIFILFPPERQLHEISFKRGCQRHGNCRWKASGAQRPIRNAAQSLHLLKKPGIRGNRIRSPDGLRPPNTSAKVNVSVPPL